MKEIAAMRAFSSALVLALLMSTAAFADPVGRYAVTGTDPGGKRVYKGDVVVERTGDTYQVVWEIEGSRTIGTGIGNKDFIAVSYRSGSSTGIALYSDDGSGTWAGVWTYAGGTQIGTERWERRQ
jgi:hypothetical protein